MLCHLTCRMNLKYSQLIVTGSGLVIARRWEVEGIGRHCSKDINLSYKINKLWKSNAHYNDYS